MIMKIILSEIKRCTNENTLHYSLGLPPYRSGGLTKYCTDLMVEQAKSNDEIFYYFRKNEFYKKR